MSVGAVFQLPVGPILVEVDAPADLSPHPAEALMEGFSVDDSRERPLKARVCLRRSAEAEGSPTETMRFRRDGEGSWRDDSEGWMAHLTGLGGAESPTIVAATRARLDRRGLWSRAVSHLLRALVPAMLSQGRGLLVHGCAMRAPEGHAVVFLGPSGEGKSTMARRLPGWTLMADDHVLLELAGGRVMASGTLFAGKEGHPRREAPAVVASLAFLRKGASTLAVSRLSEEAAYQALLRRTLWFMEDPDLTAGVMAVLAEVVSRVDAWELASGLEHPLGEVAHGLAGALAS